MHSRPPCPPLRPLEVLEADQAHLTRDFRELSGTSPGRYRRAAPLHPNHLPVL